MGSIPGKCSSAGPGRSIFRRWPPSPKSADAPDPGDTARSKGSQSAAFVVSAPEICSKLPPLIGSHLPQIRDVPQRRCPEQTVVFTAELGRALVADLKRCGRGIQALCQHQPPGFLQAELLLELQRAEGGNGPEVVMEGGTAHAGLGREIIDTELLGEITLKPVDCPGYLLTLAPRRRNLAQTLPLISHQQPVDDPPLNDRRQDRYVPFFGEQVDQSMNGGEQRQRHLAGCHAAA